MLVSGFPLGGFVRNEGIGHGQRKIAIAAHNSVDFLVRKDGLNGVYAQNLLKSVIFNKIA